MTKSSKKIIEIPSLKYENYKINSVWIESDMRILNPKSCKISFPSTTISNKDKLNSVSSMITHFKQLFSHEPLSD